MKLTPSKYEVQLIYTCPDCDIEHYATVEETQFPGGVLCYCGKKIKFKAIYGTKITLKTKDGGKKKNVEKNVEKQVDSELLEDVVSALCNTGYKKLDAKKKAKEAINVYDNVEDCINYCFK